jgi:RNA polymerase sigma factor (sigma-70 family)
MAETSSSPFIHHIRHLIGIDPAAGLTDSQLLERFLTERDETAVEVLVRRYGPLVFGVCRRALQNTHAAEDAFQATFLVLMRKAPALHCHEPLGGWLYRVAYRLALRARANEARRRHCETQAAHSQPPTEDRTKSPSDLVVALEEELQRLPARYRAPLVLCYLEGKTNEQAAAILGCPAGSMSARLSQARQRLRQCLTRRGFAAPAAAVTTALATAGAKAAVPLPLLDNTVRAAVWFARAEAASVGFVSTQAVALARGACQAMFVHKLKIAAVLVAAAMLLGTGATMLLKAAPQASPPAQAAEQPPPQARPEHAEVPGARLPRGVLARMGSTQLRHGDAVSFAAYLPDGKALVTAGKDRTVRLWDLATGKEIRRFDWGLVQPDRQAEPSEDGPLESYEQQLCDDTARSCQAALSADGKVVAASRGGVVCLWETASGKKLRQLQTGEKRLLQLVFAADGRSLLTLGRDKAAAVWEVATGACLRRSPGKLVESPYAEERFLLDSYARVSPGLKYLAFVRRDDSKKRWIQVRDLAAGTDLPPIPAEFPLLVPLAMCFSADDRTLFWENIASRDIVVWDVAAGKEVRRLGKHPAPRRIVPAAALAVSADGKFLAVCRWDPTIELWDLTSGKQTVVVGEHFRSDNVSAWTRPALAYSPDGTRLVCSLGSATLRQFQADMGKEIPAPDAGGGSQASGNSAHRWPVWALALSGDGQSLCSYSPGNPARYWDWRTGRQTGQLDVPANAKDVVFAGDGRHAFAVGNKVTLCRGREKKILQIGSKEMPLQSLALSPDGALLATRFYWVGDRVVYLWDTETLKKRHTLPYTLGPEEEPRGSGDDSMTQMAGVVSRELVFSADGRYLAGAGLRSQLCLWDTATGTLLWELTPQAGQVIERFAFAPSGRILAGLNADRTVSLYDAASGAQRGRLGQADSKRRRVHLTNHYDVPESTPERRNPPVCLAFSADGRYLATAQETPEIRLWDVLAGREVGQLQGHEGGVVSLLFAPDGKHLFSGGTDTTALTWDLTRLPQPEAARAVKLEPQALEALWTELADQDGARGFDALRKLSASPDQAVLLVQVRLRPAAPPDTHQLAQLLAELQSDRFEARRQAESELQGLGERAEAALRQALAEDPPPDLRQRLERLRDKLFMPTAGLTRDLRAIELLELIGTAEARQVLGALAGGAPGARLTREAQSAVQRLTKRAVAP